MSGQQERTGQKADMRCLATADVWLDTTRQLTLPTMVEVVQECDLLLQK